MSLDLFETVFKETFVLADKKKRVGSYNLGRVIGRGAFGTVRLGTHLLSGEQVSTASCFVQVGLTIFNRDYFSLAVCYKNNSV